MRDPVPNAALPRAPTSGREEGRSAAHERHKATQVRCPDCDKLLAEHLHGTLITVCPRCKKRVTATR
jgi:uncharacterized paraquat-inducible protein A